MKIHIPACVALAMAFISSTAYGQYSQQQVSPPQNWQVPIVQASSVQEPELTVQSNAAPANYDVYDTVVNDSGQEKYFTIFGGASTFNDIGLNINTANPGPTNVAATLNQNDGWTAGGGIGKRLAPRIRGELEWSYRNASINTGSISVNNVNLGTIPLSGQLNAYRSTSNLYFDVNPNGKYNLYFGGGMGLGYVDLDATETTTPITAQLKTSSFVYQGVVGVSAKVNSRVEMFVDYRYTGTDRLEFDAATPAGTVDLDVDITSNDIFVGFRIKR